MPSIREAKERMDAAIEAMRREFATVRTGKASPALLDTVRVEAYGGKLPVNQVASVTTPEPSLIVLQPWDKSLIGAIERAIQTADLGLNPNNDGNVIRIPIPPLNEERRKEYVRLLHKLAEEGRISVRHSRRLARENVKRREKDGDLSEDDARRQEEELDTMTHDYITKIDEALQKKEKEVLEV